ncbi:hypothetical protein GCM10009422_03810 [Brevundimonas kwangchunensis]|uniref:Cell wall hydrolase n=1 Tax=Brevundimonas kwangchunensis TaxID=322163 RepID=A0ABP3RQJ3_9CAUL
MTRLPLACAAAVLTLAAVPALAQQAKTVAPVAVPQQAEPSVGSEEWLRQRGETYSAAPDSAQNPAEIEATSKLNAGNAAQAEAAERADAEARAAFEAENQRWREEQARSSTARAQWEADVAAADSARTRWERERAQWEADVAACRASNRVCIVPEPPAAPK